jgi:hypothetical protein
VILSPFVFPGLSLEEVAVHTGNRVLTEVVDNSLPIVGNLQGILCVVLHILAFSQKIFIVNFMSLSNFLHIFLDISDPV